MKKKILSLKRIKESLLKFKNKKVVLCHGVFDLLHIGHIRHFNEAKKNGDILIVSITPDKYVKKGPNRPVFSASIRMEAISELDCVDYVFINTTPTAVNPISIFKPHFYCKGAEYKNFSNDLTGEIKNEIKCLKRYGGKIVYTGGDVFSSSSIINKTDINLTNEQISFLNKIKSNKTYNKVKKLSEIFKAFENLKILVIGETIIDEYNFCEALGKSGKEPVLVLRDLYKEKYLGGTAAIAKNLTSFSKKITLISALGEKNEEVSFVNKNLGKTVKSYFLKKKNSPTIVKKRFVEDINKTKVLGVYSINDQSLYKQEESKFNNWLRKEIPKNDLVIVSDYGHGLISNNSAKNILKKSKFLAVNTQLNASNAGYHVISKYKKANMVIINETELRHELRNKIDKVDILIKQISKKINSSFIVVTCGRHGSKIYDRMNKKIINCPAFANQVKDKIGTGDTMLALLSVAIYKKLDLRFCMLLSSIAAAYNISHMANSTPLSRGLITKAVQSYLK